MVIVRRALCGLAALALAATATAGCSGEAHDDHLGRAGESGHSDHSGSRAMPTVPAVASSESWNQADGEFLVMMLPHHQQALEMVELARTRAASTGLLAIADRIGAAQGPEILVMSDWLVDHGIDLPPTDMSQAMGAMTMTGMLSQAQMSELAEAEGDEFDQLFLAGMVTHHEGAIAMADDELRDGEDVQILDLAENIKIDQTVEIDRMQQLVADLG